MKILGFEFNRQPAARSQQPVAVVQEPKKGKSLSSTVNRLQPYRVSMQMSTLRNAVDTARDPYNPSWIDLYEIYRNALTDAQVRSQYETAVNKLHASPFVVSRNGKDSEELTELLQRPWFTQFLTILFDAEMQGYTLAEFGRMDKKGEFEDCKVFPRSNVYPFNKNIIVSPTDIAGLYYGDNPAKYYLLEIGDTLDLGLLEMIAREVIWKTFARRDWSELGEKWGSPRLIMKTDAEGAELTARQNAAASFGHNGYMITSTDDEIQTVESSSGGNGYLLFQKHIELANQEIAKLINGQTGTSDEQAYVGSAEVHERILNDFHSARLRRYTNLINYQLFPFLQKFGYALQEGDTIRFTELDPKELTPGEGEGEEDNNDGSSQDEGGTVKKKVEKVAVSSRQNPKPATRNPQPVTIVAAQPDKLEDWLRRFYKGVEGIDPDIWEMNFNSLLNAMRAAGVSMSTSYEYAELATALQENAAVFAAFKNHDEQANLAKLLVDEAGEPRSLNDFIKAAKPLTEQYNVEWLKTEFSQAKASAQMAVKWEGFKENADLYPNLQYRTVGDTEVRPEHAALNGLIAPINDPVWNTIYPPNGWGCRCNVTQTDKDEYRPDKSDGFEPDKGFDFNPGKDRKLFADNTSYTASDKQRTELEKAGRELLKGRNK